MLRRLLARMRRDHRGFTIIETLVACVTGLIVSAALFAILEVGLHQSTRISDVAQATQSGRTAMNRIVDAMHSGCITEKFTPVQEGSGPNKLILISGYSEATEVPTKATLATGVHKDVFEWVVGKNRLVDSYSLSSSEVSAGKYAWEAAKEFRLGDNIYRVEKENPETKKLEEQPVFKYYEYATTSANGTSEASSTLTQITKFEGGEGTLSGAQAKKVASVSVEFRQLPTDERKKHGEPVNFNTQVTLTFSAPDSEATITGGPCE